MSTEHADHAYENARMGMASILGMVQRLEHAQDQDSDCGKDFDTQAEHCPITPEESEAGSGWGASDFTLPEIWDEYHDQEQAEQHIQEDALSIEVRDNEWATPGQAGYSPTQFQILLTTGGPALRIMGELDEHQEPRRAWLEYQDWGTPWTEYHGDNASQDALLAYSLCFYFAA